MSVGTIAKVTGPLLYSRREEEKGHNGNARPKKLISSPAGNSSMHDCKGHQPLTLYARQTVVAAALLSLAAANCGDFRGVCAREPNPQDNCAIRNSTVANSSLPGLSNRGGDKVDHCFKCTADVGRQSTGLFEYFHCVDNLHDMNELNVDWRDANITLLKPLKPFSPFDKLRESNFAPVENPTSSLYYGHNKTPETVSAYIPQQTSPVVPPES
ncbi:MAG: hypothetical protein ACE5JX_22790, partial [Acidobacteriota bacterium]